MFYAAIHYLWSTISPFFATQLVPLKADMNRWDGLIVLGGLCEFIFLLWLVSVICRKFLLNGEPHSRVAYLLSLPPLVGVSIFFTGMFTVILIASFGPHSAPDIVSMPIFFGSLFGFVLVLQYGLQPVCLCFCGSVTGRRKTWLLPSD